MHKTRKPLVYSDREEVMQAVIRLLANREHSQAEIIKKLSARCPQLAMLESVIRECQEMGYQSDERYAQMLIRTRVEQSYGLLRVRHELQTKGLDRELIEIAIEELEIDWYEVASNCFVRKYLRQFDFENVKLKEKVIRSMANRGFSLDEVYHAININNPAKAI